MNKNYAARFEKRKKQQELARLREKFGDEDDDEDQSSEDEDAELLTPALDVQIFKTIDKIRNRKPEIYQKDAKFFAEPPTPADREDDDDDDCDGDEDGGDLEVLLLLVDPAQGHLQALAREAGRPELARRFFELLLEQPRRRTASAQAACMRLLGLHALGRPTAMLEDLTRY